LWIYEAFYAHLFSSVSLPKLKPKSFKTLCLTS
jgi:hypothetical protein